MQNLLVKFAGGFVLSYLLVFLTFLGTFLSVFDSRSIASESCVDIYQVQPLKSALEAKFSEAVTDEAPTPEAWGYHAIVRDLAPVADFFAAQKGKPAGEIIDAAMASPMRVLFFRLQSSAKVYEALDKKFFEPLRDDFKAMEDSLGHLDLARDLKKSAAKMGNEKLVTKFERQEAEKVEELRATMERMGWLKDPEAVKERIERKLRNYEGWLSRKQDRKFILDEIAEAAHKLHKDSKNYKFDRKDIEKGFHELRRRLRWIIIQIQSFDGLVVHSDEKLPKKIQKWFDELIEINPKLLNSKYIVFTEPQVGKPIKIPQKMQAMIGEIVELIGKQKDRAEKLLYIEKALQDPTLSRAAREELHRRLKHELGGDQPSHRELSVQYMDRLNETDLLKEFSKQVEELNR